MEFELLVSAVRSIFATHGLRRADQSRLADTRIPIDSKRFLGEVGLPKDEFLGFRFNLLDLLPSLAAIAGDKRTMVGRLKEGMVCLGSIYDVVVCIDTLADGSIWTVDLDGEEADRMVNSRVEILGYFFGLYVRHRQRTRGASEAVIALSAIDLKSQMLRADPIAMSSPASWWMIVLDDIELGML